MDKTSYCASDRNASIGSINYARHIVHEGRHGTDFMWAVTKLSAPNDARIAFGRPLQFTLSVDEQSCLLNSSGTDLHEQLFAEALASNYAMDISDVDTPLKFENMFGTWKPAAFEESCCDGVLRKISLDIGVDLVGGIDKI